MSGTGKAGEYQVEVGFKGVGHISVEATSKADAIRKVRAGEYEEWDQWNIEETFPRSVVGPDG